MFWMPPPISDEDAWEVAMEAFSKAHKWSTGLTDHCKMYVLLPWEGFFKKVNGLGFKVGQLDMLNANDATDSTPVRRRSFFRFRCIPKHGTTMNNLRGCHSLPGI